MQRPPYVLSVPKRALHAVDGYDPWRGADRTAAVRVTGPLHAMGHIHPRRGADRTAAVRVTGPPR